MTEFWSAGSIVSVNGSRFSGRPSLDMRNVRLLTVGLVLLTVLGCTSGQAEPTPDVDATLEAMSTAPELNLELRITPDPTGIAGPGNLYLGVKEGCPEAIGCVASLPPSPPMDAFQVYLCHPPEGRRDCNGLPRLSHSLLSPGAEVDTWLIEVAYPGPRQLNITFGWDQDGLRERLSAQRPTKLHLWDVDSDKFIDIIETADFYLLPAVGDGEPQVRAFLICSRVQGVERECCLP